MRVAIHTLGTRGDVQPYLALAREFRAKGHEVLLIAPAQFAGSAAAERLAFAPLPAEFLDMLDAPETKDVLGRSGTGFGAGFKLIKRYRHLMQDLLDAEWYAARAFRPHTILFHPKALGAPHNAKKLDVPLFLASPLPGFTPTAAFPTPILPVRSLGPLNRMSHALMIHGGSVIFSKTVRDWRVDTLGLPARGKPAPRAGSLYGYSPHVVPKPLDWGRDVAVTGYWFLNTPDWQPDTDLAAFLKAGEPPVYVGFGSMPGLDPIHLTHVVIEGLRRAGKRGLLATAGGALGPVETTSDLHVIAGAPHDCLFPHGPAHNAASQFPSNANSTAAIALAGVGFEKTRTVLIADPAISRNIHRLEVQGDFGNMLMEVEGRSLPGHPKTSSLAALSVARAMKINCGAISI